MRVNISDRVMLGLPKGACSIEQFGIEKVIDSQNRTLRVSEYFKLFNILRNGEFRLLSNDKAYNRLMIYIRVMIDRRIHVFGEPLIQVQIRKRPL